MSHDAISIIVTVVLAFLGYIITYFNNVRIENRKAQVKFISDQIEKLYGPLYSMSKAGEEAWRSFRSRCRPTGAFFDPRNPPTPQELEQWRLWMSEIFMPLHLKMENVITANAHLIEGGLMPQSFMRLLAHVEVYKIVARKWAQGDFSEHTAYFDFPREFDVYVSAVFESLKRRQVKLIGITSTGQ
jgi:hypothetical protein